MAKLFYLNYLLLSIYIGYTRTTELTFELADNAKQCFHEEIRKNTSCTLEFQVVTGGQYDVDVVLQDPQKNVLYSQQKSQYDTHTFKTTMTGVHTVCFSNEFSTFSHKLIYVDFQVGEEAPLPGIGEHVTALTQMESSSQDIHKALTTIVDLQTHHRLREAQSRKRAEELNEKVLHWSLLETFAILAIGLTQIFTLKRFFTEKKPTMFK